MTFGRPNDVINNEWLEEYRTLRGHIWAEIVQINGCLFVIRRVDSFPFRIFAPYRETPPFWQLVQVTFYETAILTMWKILFDKSNALNLFGFKNKLRANLKESSRPKFDSSLKSVGVEKALRSACSRFTKFRHSVIAHTARDWLHPTPEELQDRRFGWRELKQYCQQTNQFFSLLCLGETLAPLHADYFLSETTDERSTDIDQLLSEIARKSASLDLPERSPQAWEELKRRLSSAELDQFDLYRKQFRTGAGEL